MYVVVIGVAFSWLGWLSPSLARACDPVPLCAQRICWSAAYGAAFRATLVSETEAELTAFLAGDPALGEIGSVVEFPLLYEIDSGEALIILGYDVNDQPYVSDALAIENVSEVSCGPYNSRRIAYSEVAQALQGPDCPASMRSLGLATEYSDDACGQGCSSSSPSPAPLLVLAGGLLWAGVRRRRRASA
ncbi:MAG: hypothetical protein Tsb0020_54050 [Haliangiales bacterium]